MFIKLRNKFLILNMTLISLVMAAAFAAVYLTTYYNIRTDIHNKLNTQPSVRVSNSSHVGEKGLTMGNQNGEVVSYQTGLDNMLLFSIQVDSNGKLLSKDTFTDLSRGTYQKAAEMAWRNKDDYSTITLDGRKWDYVIRQNRVNVVQENGQQQVIDDGNYQITFLDVTDSDKTLFELLTTLIGVGLAMLGALFFISLYFANRSIKPIADTWIREKRFVADASHELKTPLAIINANYDALMANSEETIESQMKWFDYIKIGTDRMTKLINDLLTLTKMEEINVEISKEPFNLSRTVYDVIVPMEAVMIDKKIKLSLSIEPEIAVKSDSERIMQVVMILLDNAIKYTNENGQIDISLTKLKRQVLFSIKNSGKGIPEADLPKVFDRFYRSDPSRTQKTGGYGLGLSIAKTIMNKLGGKIEVKSAENEYTVFTFMLGL